MDGSILLVGEPQFMSRFSDLIEHLGLHSIESVSDVAEAISLVQAQQPDVLLLQADYPGALDLCRTFKDQGRLSWIYIILVGQLQWVDWFSAIATSQHIAQEEEAVEAGADAFAWCAHDINSQPIKVLGGSIPQDTCDASCQPEALPDPPLPFDANHFSQLLLRSLGAKIKSGLRRVQNHRELMRTNDLLSAIALSDPLTELNNRRAFEWELPRQIQNARTRKAPISLLVLDVDYFKSINDNYGHLVGDRALQLISARLRHNLRFCDTPFRYGGEEFIVILSDTDGAEALRVGHRLRRRMAERPFALSDTLDVTITISIGSASLLPSDDDRGLSLLNRADRNLLSAKSQGRNQVVASQDSSPG
ncbi:MAG: diguanylate cyclase [Synechococcales cyanobacterium K44_A2020_017]|nr:diguanylate cyclase [Synechococcales cyanobacterium K32_A2020_035]MBF2093876.1 diguanylate cyclase [Synechococcales cyanobacterium K44_A2020_017]